jgi:hypothetical protein
MSTNYTDIVNSFQEICFNGKVVEVHIYIYISVTSHILLPLIFIISSFSIEQND